MTSRVKSLTDRATEAGAPQNVLPLAGIAPLIDAFERLGCDRAALAVAAGLTCEDFADPDATLPDAACGALFEEVARRLPCANLGLRTAAEIPIGAFPLLDYLVLTSPTVGDGFRHLENYLRLSASPTALQVGEGPEGIEIAAVTGNPFSNEFTFSLALFHFRRETEGRFGAARIRFRHRVGDRDAFERELGCRVQDEMEADVMTISRSAWKLPLRRGDSVLQQMLRRQAEDLVSREDSQGGVLSQLRRALAPRVAGGETSLAAVSRHLGASPRTLQRRLAAEGLSYQKVLDGVRLQAAECYLSDSSLSCSEVGYLLGFSEPAAFHRAFKRWRGSTPLEFRRSRRSQPTDRPD